MAQREVRKESETVTAKRLGMTQPGLFKVKRSGLSFRLSNFVRYCNETGYEVVVVPKQYVPMLGNVVTVIREDMADGTTE